jgi:tetratricopeptide (TPR) repeat protein
MRRLVATAMAVALAAALAACQAGWSGRDPEAIAALLGPCAELSGEPAVDACLELTDSDLADSVKAEAYDIMCLELCGLGRYKEAAEACERGMEMRFGHEFYSGPMLVLSALGHDPVALAMLSRGGKLLVPEDDPGSLLMLGWTLDLLGRLDEALPVLEEAARLRPENAFILYRLGLVLVRLGRPYEGLESARQAARLDPDNLAFWGLLAWAAAYSGEDDEARTAFEMILRLDPSYLEEHPELRQVWETCRGERPGSGSWCAKT